MGLCGNLALCLIPVRRVALNQGTVQNDHPVKSIKMGLNVYSIVVKKTFTIVETYTLVSLYESFEIVLVSN